MLCLALRQEEIASTRRPASELSSAAENRKPRFSGRRGKRGKWGDSNNFLVLAPDLVRAHSGVCCVDPLSHRSFVCCRFQSLHCATTSSPSHGLVSRGQTLPVGSGHARLPTVALQPALLSGWASSPASHSRTVLKSRGSALPLCHLLSTSVARCPYPYPHCRLRHSPHCRLSPLSQPRTLETWPNATQRTCLGRTCFTGTGKCCMFT